MTPTIWQQLGAFVITVQNLSDWHLDKFRDAHGSWIVPVVYGDNASGPWNRDHLADLKLRCAHRGIKVGGWFNGWGAEPKLDASAITQVAAQNNLTLLILDLESPYQWPGGEPGLMPSLVRELRVLNPKADIAVTTNAMTNAMIWNGRTLAVPLSFYDLGIRVIPQWYSWLYYKDNAYLPARQMQWLRDVSPNDGNFRDNNASKTAHRGLPLSFVHGVLETTGLEGASLSDELARVAEAKQFGYTTGISIYSLENAPQGDFDLLHQYYGKLYS